MKLPFLVKNNVKIEWVNLGEGYSGDYDPNDEDDTNLLRFDILRLENNEWNEVPDGSYCTLMPVNTDKSILVKALEMIMKEVYADISTHGSAKRLCEQMSWISPKTFA